jgi:hypothetical protein
MKKILFMLLISANVVFGQTVTGDIVGTVVDANSGEKIFNARAIVEDNGRKYQALSDPDGRFRIPAIPSGKYTLYIIYMKDTMNNIVADVPMEAYCNLGNIQFEPHVKVFKDIKINPNVRLVFGDLPIKELTANEIKRSPNKFDIKTLAISMSTDVRMDDDGQLMFRGARKGDMIYILDGIKSNEVFNVPSCSISKMMVFTGGLPAKYGDTLGGAIVVETKGYFELLRNYKAQQ